MKARTVRFHRVGGPDVLEIEDLDVGDPAAGEVRVRVLAIGLNRAEAAYRAGRYIETPQLPSRLGYEACAVVEAIGPGVSGVAVGDTVCVLPAFSMNRYGTYAEHAIVPANALIPAPAGLAATDAAALWMASLTAYGALVEIGRIGVGDAVLIPAASSSLGLAAIQIARMLGAIPIAITRSPAKAGALREHGAAHVLAPGDGLAAEVAAITEGKGARLAFDPVAGPEVLTLAEALGAGGTLVIYGNLSGQGAQTPFPFNAAVGRGLSVRGYLVFELLRDAARLRAARSFIEAGLSAGALRPVIDRVFPFDQIVAAHRHLESNAQVGKVVVEVTR